MIKLFRSYPRVIWLLAISMAINIMGISFLWPLNTLYIVEVLGKTVSIAGIVLMLQQGAGILGSLSGGYLFDKWGAKRTILLGTSSAIIFVFLLTFADTLTQYVILMLLLGLSTGLVFPSMYAMAGAVWQEGGRKAFNILYVAQNLGVALGSVLGGIVAQVSFRLIFPANAVAFVIFLLIIVFGFKKKYWILSSEQTVIHKNSLPDSVFVKRQFRSYLPLIILAFAFILTWMPYVQWQTSISSYMKTLGISLSMYTLLWTINGALIVLGQPIVAIVTNKLLKTTKQQMISGTLIFFLAYAILFNNTLYSGFLLAMVIMTFGEMLVWPAVPTAADQLAPKGKKGFYQGVVSGAASAGRMLGFLVGGFLYDYTSMNNLLIIMLFLFLVAILGFVYHDRFSSPLS